MREQHAVVLGKLEVPAGKCGGDMQEKKLAHLSENSSAPYLESDAALKWLVQEQERHGRCRPWVAATQSAAIARDQDRGAGYGVLG